MSKEVHQQTANQLQNLFNLILSGSFPGDRFLSVKAALDFVQALYDEVEKQMKKEEAEEEKETPKTEENQEIQENP